MDLGFDFEELDKEATVAAPPAVEEAGVQEITADTMQVIQNCRNSLDFLAALAMPDVYQYAFPPVFLSVWDWLTSYSHKIRDFSQLALGLPRGFGKTMLMKLFLLYCILFTKKRFILVCCENAAKAVNIIADVVDMLDSENIKRVFGDWRLGLETDQQALKKFGFRGRNIILLAGTVEVIRGITLKNQRPDVILFDDIQSRLCAESQVQSDTLEREMTGTAMKAKSPHGCLFIFVANMYPTKYSLLRKLKTNPNWVKFIAGGILADGTSLWEELQPLQQLLVEFENDLNSGHPEIFYSEVLNDENASCNNNIDLSKVPAYPFADDDIPAGNFIIIDPSNDKANSDAVSIGYCEVFEGYPVLRSLIEGRFSPGDTIDHALKLALQHNCRLIVIESNAYQYSLNYWFRFICEQRGIYGIEACEIYSGSLSKNSRILTMFKALLAGELYIHPDAKAAAYLQITQFNALKRDNTDGILDLLTYMPRVLEMYGEFVVSMTVLVQQDHGTIQVLPAAANSPF